MQCKHYSTLSLARAQSCKRDTYHHKTKPRPIPDQTTPHDKPSSCGKEPPFEGKEIAASLTSTTITKTTTSSSTISAFRAYHLSRRFLKCPNIILATCRHKVPPTVRSDRNFSVICLFSAQQANEYMCFPTNCCIGFSSFPKL